jgi:transcriptional regulator with XRE-family HTH domain
MDAPARLQRWLEESGVTQIQFAEATGMTQSLVSKYLHRQRRPKLENRLLIEEATGGAVTVAMWGEPSADKDEG